MEIELKNLIAKKNGQISRYDNENNILQEEDSYCKPKTIKFCYESQLDQSKISFLRGNIC